MYNLKGACTIWVSYIRSCIPLISASKCSTLVGETTATSFSYIHKSIVTNIMLTYGSLGQTCSLVSILSVLVIIWTKKICTNKSTTLKTEYCLCYEGCQPWLPTLMFEDQVSAYRHCYNTSCFKSIPQACKEYTKGIEKYSKQTFSPVPNVKVLLFIFLESSCLCRQVVLRHLASQWTLEQQLQRCRCSQAWPSHTCQHKWELLMQ